MHFKILDLQSRLFQTNTGRLHNCITCGNTIQMVQLHRKLGKLLLLTKDVELSHTADFVDALL